MSRSSVGDDRTVRSPMCWPRTVLGPLDGARVRRRIVLGPDGRRCSSSTPPISGSGESIPECEPVALTPDRPDTCGLALRGRCRHPRRGAGSSAWRRCIPARSMRRTMPPRPSTTWWSSRSTGGGPRAPGYRCRLRVVAAGVGRRAMVGLGRVGPPQHAVGLHPADGRPDWVRTPRAAPTLVDGACVAGRAATRPSSNRSGTSTTDCGSARTARTGGSCIISPMRAGRSGDPLSVDHGSGDVALPPWVFGESRYAMLTDRRVVFAFSLDGVDHLAAYDSVSGRVDRLERRRHRDPSGASRRFRRGLRRSVVHRRSLGVRRPWSAAAAPPRPPSSVRPPSQPPLSSSFISVGRPISFPTADGATSHAIYYPPTNSEFIAPCRGRGHRSS